MSDWKSRAKKVEGWKANAIPVTGAKSRMQPDDDHLVQSAPEPDDFLTSRTAATVLGGAEGASLGFADEIGGAANAVQEKGKQALQAIGLMDPDEHVSDALVQPGVKINGKTVINGVEIPDSGPKRAASILEAYRAGRDDSESIRLNAKRAHPNYYLAGEVAGSLAVPVPKVAAAAKGAPFLARAVQYGKSALPVALTMAAGTSNADLTRGEVGKLLADTTTGGALGTALGGAAGAGVEKLGAKGAELLREWAKRNALKAAGARGGIVNAMQKMGYETMDEAEELGAHALDSNLIPFMGDKNAVWQRATEKLNQVGPAIRGVYEAADKAGPVLADGQTVMSDAFDFDAAAKAAAKPLQGINTVADRNAAKAKQLVNDIASQGKNASRFTDALEIGTSMGGDVNHAVETKEAQKLHKAVYNAFKNNRTEQLENVLGPDEVDTLRSLNKVYSVAKDVKKLASNASTREAVNRTQGLIGTLQGQTLANVLPEAAAPAGLIWPKIENLLTQRVPAGLAVAQNKGSQALNALMASKYAPILTNAATKGTAALAAAHYVLSQKDPDYRALAEAAASEQQEQ